MRAETGGICLRVGGGRDLRDAAAAAFGSDTKQQRAPEERARLPQLPPAQRKQEHASVAVFPHADPKQSLSKHSGSGGRGGGSGRRLGAAFMKPTL